MNILKHSPVRVNPVTVHPAEQRLSLDGPWDFRLDPHDRGLEEGWFREPNSLGEVVDVPGTWQGQGFGGSEKETLRDFCLRHQTLRATYTGTGWYGRTFEIPERFYGRCLHLQFGGVHPSARVWLNGVPIGENDLPFVPFGFDISPLIRWGDPNRDRWRVLRRFPRRFREPRSERRSRGPL
jgi:beta-galactosidase/beta-glucuronidase